METEIQNLLDALADLRKRANANACFGKPLTSEGRTVIPVAEVAYGFEIGVEQETTAEAAGRSRDGMHLRPMAIVEVTSESVRVEPIINEQKVALAGGLLIAWAVFWLAWALVRILGSQK